MLIKDWQVEMRLKNRYDEIGIGEKKEVEDAKNAIINKFPLRVSSNKDILNYISMIAYYDLPLDYLVNFEKNIQSVTPKNIKDALKEVLLDENFITVVVGNENPF